jgi:hypothetical protein
MINRPENVSGAKPERLAADTAHGTGKMLAWLMDKGILPHIPVWERCQRTDGMFPSTDFTCDAERDIYLCPNGKPLRTSGTIHNVASEITCHEPENAAFAILRNGARARHSGRSYGTSRKTRAIMRAL